MIEFKYLSNAIRAVESFERTLGWGDKRREMAQEAIREIERAEMYLQKTNAVIEGGE